MAQDLTVNIKTTSDVPQAMDKAKAATVSFSKQLEDIQKKFSTAFKDIALGFIAPMVLLNAAINFISSAIEKRKQDIKEAYDFAVRAESKYLDSETVVLAKQRSAREQDEKEREMAKAAKQTEFTKFLEQPGMRDKVASEIGGFRGFRIKTGIDANSAEDLAKDADVQAVIARMIAPAVAASKKAADIVAEPKLKGADFKGPEGFSNVVGVGANPVIEAMTQQLDEAKKTNELLSQIANASGARTASWLNSANAPAPSRASMLAGNK
jgi:hypothetical protein